MVKRLADARVLPSPGLKEAPVMDRMCTQFVLTLTVKHAGRFNLRRDCTGLLSFVGRHLVWPASVLASSAPRMPSGTTSITENGTDQLSYNAARHRNTNRIDTAYSIGACEPDRRSW